MTEIQNLGRLIRREVRLEEVRFNGRKVKIDVQIFSCFLNDFLVS